MRKLLLLVGALCFAIGGNAFAFHDAGVANCAGCHTMHNSQGGKLVDPDSPDGNPWLLKDATPSDVCLSCHATSRGAVFTADPLAPPTTKGGGNFVFLLEDNINDGHGGATSPIPGSFAGHSIDAPSKGVGPDGTLTKSPGGDFPSSILGCSSCHDPHGNTHFRLLYGVGDVQAGLASFDNPAPEAIGLSTSGSGGTEANNKHTAYLSGMSAWCGNCHGDYHAPGTASKSFHPTGENLGATVANTYALYNGTVDLTGGDPATSYLAAVPFEDPSNVTTSTGAPSATSKVMCLTCHRAHASSAANAGRWDFQVTLLEEDGAESGSYAIPDPYANANQRSLCNKCHAKDADDHIIP